MSNLNVHLSPEKPARTVAQKVGGALGNVFGFGCIAFGSVLVLSSALWLLVTIWRSILS
jgi:hypothetical protein